jgi:hypothetical protein
MDFETIELITPDDKLPDVAQGISVTLVSFDDPGNDWPDFLYYARLRIRYRGAGVERVDLEAQTMTDWQDATKIQDDDPSTCTAPTEASPPPDHSGTGSVVYEPQSPAGTFGSEILVSVVREESSPGGDYPYPPWGRLWVGPVASGVPIPVGPPTVWEQPCDGCAGFVALSIPL